MLDWGLAHFPAVWPRQRANREGPKARYHGTSRLGGGMAGPSERAESTR
jgi:hypothetical protein